MGADGQRTGTPLRHSPTACCALVAGAGDHARVPEGWAGDRGRWHGARSKEPCFWLLLRGGQGDSSMTQLRQEFKISVRGLEVDMFVARLDRPWLGTSFPLQGFKIRSAQDIKALQRLCSHVYVDTSSGRSPDPRFIEFDDDDQVRKARAAHEVAELRKTDWDIRSDFETELPLAQEAHETLQRGISEVMGDLQDGRDLDLQKLQDGVDAMIESITRNPSAFTWLKELKRKDNYAYQHALGSSVWAATFGRHLGLERSDLGDLALAGLLCDVGKTRLSSEKLRQQHPLSAPEVDEMRGHVQHGLDILAKTPGVSQKVIDAVATHHERYDGSGYPKGLRSSDIPMFGRVIGMIDSYDAMTSIRPYAVGRSPHQAVMELYEGRDTLYQAELVEQFIQACGIYPTGSLVELTDGRVGVVTAVHTLKRLRPSVMLLLDENKAPLPEFRSLDMSETREDSSGQALNVKCGLPPGAYGVDTAELFLD
ncbi:MAG: HD domain-containing phosphohydrolase [Luteimonas sp.]